jgi:hypothetical protein
MKLATVLKLAAPLLAADKSPDQLRRLILAADKKAKDTGNTGLGPKELEERDVAKAQDARECALDEREAAMDAAEEKADKDKDDKDAKDRKTARDARKGARDARGGARDARAHDRDDDPEGTNDEDLLNGADPSTPGGSRAGGKTAVDSAEVDKRIAAAVNADRVARESLQAARSAVEPILGIVAMDSAAEVYKAAFVKLGVDVAGVDASAYPALLKLAKDRGEAAPAAMDSTSGSVEFAKAIPGYGRLK